MTTGSLSEIVTINKKISKLEYTVWPEYKYTGNKGKSEWAKLLVTSAGYISVKQKSIIILYFAVVPNCIDSALNCNGKQKVWKGDGAWRPYWKKKVLCELTGWCADARCNSTTQYDWSAPAFCRARYRCALIKRCRLAKGHWRWGNANRHKERSTTPVPIELGLATVEDPYDLTLFALISLLPGCITTIAHDIRTYIVMTAGFGFDYHSVPVAQFDQWLRRCH